GPWCRRRGERPWFSSFGFPLLEPDEQGSPIVLKSADVVNERKKRASNTRKGRRFGRAFDSGRPHFNNRSMAEGPAEGPQSIRVDFSSWMSAGDGAAASRSVILPWGTTLGLLLRHLSTELGVDLIAATTSGGNAFVIINETNCMVPRDLHRRLEDGDVVLLMPFIAGG
ncbi:MAG: MoaD/ThiS family protein, partial [Actinobacteria bacterium]|nr:MoaD/ThiS family protein [Actinomycetota bacterium]